MRERLRVYLTLALACAAAAWFALPHVDMYDVLANHPSALVATPPVSVVLALALAALTFILPSALRRIEPTFRMTAFRWVVAACTIVCVGVVTEIGYALAIVPGIAAAVLLSQVLVGALLRGRDGTGARDVVAAIAESCRGSIALTRMHFATTLGVVVASLAILLVPFTVVLFGLAVLGVRLPPSLVLTAPLLFLTFIYFECVRYALIVRWYRRLRAEEGPAASP